MSLTEERLAGAELLERAFALPGSSRDSIVLESACLERGLDTLRMSNIIVLGQGANNPVAFRGSASLHTSQFAYQVTTDRELRYVRLGQAGINVPSARAFKVKDREQLAAGARQLGYPVLAKPLAKRGSEAWDNPARDENGLAAALDSLSRDKLTRGKPRTYGRVLVEQFISGPKTSLMIVNGAVAGSLRRSDGSAAVLAQSDGQLVHPDFVQLARRTLNAVPGANHAEVVVAADDVGRKASGQKHAVVSLSVVPRLLGKRVPVGWSRQMGRAILDTSAASGVAAAPRESVTVTLRAIGLLNPARFSEALLKNTHKCLAEQRIEAASGDVVTATLAGDPFLIASISALCLSGFFGSETPQCVECVQR